MTENEFMLEDRLQKIRSTIEKYGQENFYLSFSGGKDSTVLSALVDMAIPENTIPRVYANTGIEYVKIVEFVEREREKPHAWEMVILKPSRNIRQVLEEDGYPFKSKAHSEMLCRFQNSGKLTSVKQYLGENEGREKWSPWKTCPKTLRYQFTDDFSMKVSDKCCLRMKEEPLNRWSREAKKPFGIVGIMRDEGGRRRDAVCMAFIGGKLKRFQPLAPVTKEWEEWFIDKYKIDIADVYKPPYNFVRTGCKGCPFAIELQHELDVLEKFFPAERKQCELIWKPVYEEYRRLGYRLKPQKTEEEPVIEGQISIFDYLKERGEQNE